VAVILVTGSDERLIADGVAAQVDRLVGDGDRDTMLQTRDLTGLPVEDREAAISAALDALRTPSLFGGDRVVVVRGLHEATADEAAPLVEYASSPAPDGHLVMGAGPKALPKKVLDGLKGAGATLLNTAPPSKRRELVAWFDDHFTEAGLKVEGQVVEACVDWLGEDIARLPSLIEVLAATYGRNRKLTVADVEPFLGDKGGTKPWTLTDAVDKGDFSAALGALRRMLATGEYHPLQVMALLHRHYATMLRLDAVEVRTKEDAKVAAKVNNDFVAGKLLDTQRRLGARAVSGAVRLLARADVDLRGRRDLPEELVLELLVGRLCQLSGGVPGARGRATRRR
jgi:DNA polymerase-3 subunit delta